VNFYDEGALISGCNQVPLNFPNANPTPERPAVCTTKLTTPGVHLITAAFTSQITTIYVSETLTLDGGQTVTERLPITFNPVTLPNGIYGTFFEALITPTCGSDACGMVGWGATGQMPGMELVSTTPAQFEGSPAAAGEFIFTVGAEDLGPSGAVGSITYTWNVDKATPVVWFGDIQKSWYGPEYYISIYVQHPNQFWEIKPAGPLTVSIDGNPLQECTDLQPVGSVGSYNCKTTALGGLAPGDHTITADFTPDTYHAPNYNSASGTLPYNVRPRVEGILFNDLNKDGVRDQGEELAPYAYVGLDQGCDGSSIEEFAYGGEFSIETSPGSFYCLTASPFGNWRTTTELPIKFTVEGYENQYFEIGLYETVLSITPETLPNAAVGQYYEQVISISGGAEPYKITLEESRMPEGMTFDENTHTLSGTPARADTGYIYLKVEDADGITAGWDSLFYIQTDGVFTLTSDLNPSAPGQEVTFAFSGSGDAMIPNYSEVDPIPPVGTVAFYDGEDLIKGCEGVPLNFDWDYGLMDQPAICRTSALAAGSHEIKAEFTPHPEFPLYRTATRTLTQVVESNVLSADLSLTKIDKTDPVKPGAKLVYTLTILNAGPDAAQNLTLVDTLDRNTTYGSISAPKGWSCKYANYQVTCTSAGLASGSSAVIKITVTVSKTAKVGKELVNNASVASETYDPNLLNNSVVQKTLVKK
jgi:uncharacterized repeat protein (TIGR01451 family)